MFSQRQRLSREIVYFNIYVCYIMNFSMHIIYHRDDDSFRIWPWSCRIINVYLQSLDYILDDWTVWQISACMIVNMPKLFSWNHGLQMIEGAKQVDKDRHWRIIWKLIYLSHTRPDIAYVVGVVSMFMHMPQIQHMTAVIRILRHLKGTSIRGLPFEKIDNLDLLAYTDTY